jgi:hypothetical protein
MFLNRIIFYIVLFYSVSLAAQNTGKGEVTYLDSNDNPATKENAAFYEFRTEYKPGIFKYQKFFIHNNKASLIHIGFSFKGKY